LADGHHPPANGTAMCHLPSANTRPGSAANVGRPGGGHDADPRATPKNVHGLRASQKGREPKAAARGCKKPWKTLLGLRSVGCPAMTTRALDRGGRGRSRPTACLPGGQSLGRPTPFPGARPGQGLRPRIDTDLYLATKPQPGTFSTAWRARTTLVCRCVQTASKHPHRTTDLNRANNLCAPQRTRQQANLKRGPI